MRSPRRRKQRRLSTGRRRTTPQERWAIRIILILAAVGGVLAEGEPTGWWLSDGLLRAGAAAGIAYSCSYARRWTWFVLAGGTALLADGWMVLTSGVAVLAAVAGGFAPRRSRPIGAIVGALSAQVVLRLPDLGGTYRPTLAAVALITPVVISAYRHAPRRVRRRVQITALAAAAFCVIASGFFAIAAAQARADVRRAIDLATNGLEAASDNDTERAARLLDEAATLFSDANDRLTTPWMASSRLVPVVGPNTQALADATREGAALAEAASRTAQTVDLDDLAFSAGRLDLGAVARFEDPLDSAASAVERARDVTVANDSPWLLGPVDGRLERFEAELNDAAPTLRNATDLVAAAPRLLGADEPQTYLVLFFTESELRGLGGFVGGFAELQASDGVLSLVRTGRPAELNEILRAGNPSLAGPADYVTQWGQYSPQLAFQDITLSPDFPSVADVAAQLYPQAGGTEVDGVIALDPESLGALSRITGPVEIGGERLRGDALTDYLLHGQYLDFATADSERQDLLDEALRAVFSALLEIDSPSPARVAEILGPVVDADRLVMWGATEADQELYDRIGVSGGFPELGDRDLLAVTSQNAANNKIDYFLQRSVTYDVGIEDGIVRGTITVEVTNEAAATGLPDSVIGSNDRGLELGLNRSNLTVYTPHRLRSSTLDGETIGARSGTELGVSTHAFTIDVSAGQTRTLVLDVEGVVPEVRELIIAPQPTANVDTYRIRTYRGGAVHRDDLFTPDRDIVVPLEL